MEERVDVLMPYGYTQMWISTFHSFCDRVIRQEAIHIGLNPGYTLISDTDATLILRKNIFKLGLEYFRPLGNPTKFIKGLINHFSRLKDEDVLPEQYLRYAQKLKTQNSNIKSEAEKLDKKKILELSHAYKIYQELKTKEGMMDYADLISNTLFLFRKRKNILKNYQDQFKFILVDEFQDTNIAQNELLLLLSQKNKNITAVADDDQSIYKFRGAAVSNVLSFRKNFPKSKLIVLTQNYRSTQEILDKSYRLIQHNNPDRLEVKEGINKKLISSRKTVQVPVKFIHIDRVENEADEVAKEIKNLKENESYNWNNFAILIRANNYAEPFVRSFLRHGLPFQFLGPGQLFRQSEIKDLISYLQVLVNFDDNVSLYRVLSMPYFDISPRDLVAIANFSRRYNLSLFESCEVVLGLRKIDNAKLPIISDKAIEKLFQIITIITRHLGLITKETAGQILYYFLEDTGMIKNILDYQFPIDEKKANNISKFFSKLKTYEAQHEDASVATILDWITLSMELGESPLANDTDWLSNDAINILTVHSAKGLEFKVVFIVNLVSQRFPSVEKKEQIPIPEDLIKEELPEGDYHEEEERRLFYVGMTRARDRLYFTAANYYGEGLREKKVSPFVYEALGDDAVSSQFFKPSNQLSLLEWKKVLPPDDKGKNKLILSYISYSQIDTFRFCPLHYKLRYLLSISPPTSPALSFGSSIHNALKDFYLSIKQGDKPSKEKLISLLDKNWIREGYTGKRYEKEMLIRGRGYLRNYFEKEINPKTNILSVEQPFTASVTLDGRTLKIGGRIDRIDDLGGGRIEIVDYKTGRVPTQRQVDTNLQLSIYAMAASEIDEPPFGRKVENINLTLYYFDSQQKIESSRTKKQLGEDKARIIEYVKQIEKSDFRCSGNIVCTSCEYKMFCNVYNTE